MAFIPDSYEDTEPRIAMVEKKRFPLSREYYFLVLFRKPYDGKSRPRAESESSAALTCPLPPSTIRRSGISEPSFISL